MREVVRYLMLRGRALADCLRAEGCARVVFPWKNRNVAIYKNRCIEGILHNSTGKDWTCSGECISASLHFSNLMEGYPSGRRRPLAAGLPSYERLEMEGVDRRDRLSGRQSERARGILYRARLGHVVYRTRRI
jgi:hypothetical protein